MGVGEVERVRGGTRELLQPQLCSFSDICNVSGT